MTTDSIWNRATEDLGPDSREGDRALHLAMMFDGDAEGDGVLSAVEHAVETETGLMDVRDAFTFLGLPDVAQAVYDFYLEWLEAFSAEDDRELAKLEVKSDKAYQEFRVGHRLQEALEKLYAQTPEVFAPVKH